MPKNKTFLLLMIIILPIAVVWGLYYFVYPAFRIVEINDELPADMIEMKNKMNIENNYNNDNKLNNKNNINTNNTNNINNTNTNTSTSSISKASINNSNNISNSNIIELPPQSVIETKIHPASGTARLILTKDKNIVRFENFSTIDGPDVKVYLSKSPSKDKDSILLGDIKANRGNINYEIPKTLANGEEIDFDQYIYAVHWCEAFGVLFNYVKLK